MKLQMRKVLSFAPVLILLAATTAFADGVVTLSPGPVGAGQHFTVAVNITGPTVKDVPSGVSDVYAFELDVSFPSSLVQARRVADGTFLSGGGTTYFSKGTIDNGSGTISHIFGTLVSAPSGASGSGTLVNITFQAVTAGTPEITLTKVTLLDSNLNPIVVDNTPAQMTTTVALTTAEMRNPDSTPIGATPIHGIPYWPVGAWGLTAPRAHIAEAAALERTAARPNDLFRSNASAIGTGPLGRFAGSVTGLLS